MTVITDRAAWEEEFRQMLVDALLQPAKLIAALDAPTDAQVTTAFIQPSKRQTRPHP